MFFFRRWPVFVAIIALRLFLLRLRSPLYADVSLAFTYILGGIYGPGDEIALDDDASYLDDVVKAPAAPDKEPGADSVRNKDGVPVDEFGLPQVPSAAQTTR